MRNILEMHDFILNERRASALTLLNDVVGGRTNSVEGIKLSVGMASAFLDWMRMSPYGKKYSKLPFNMLFSAAFVWGLDRYVKGKDLKDEYKELKAKAKEMKMNEAFIGPYVFNDKMSDEELKAMYFSALDGYSYYQRGMHYAKSDYKKAYQEIEKILKKRGVSVDEGIVNEIRAKKVTKQMWKKFSDDKRFDALLSVIKDPDDAEEYAFMRWEELPGWMQRDMTLFEKEYSTEQRKEMASKGLALPDGSFPIKDIKDLKNAILSYGRSTDHSEVAKFIAKRAKALGAEDLIPDTENFQKALKETDKKGEYIPYYESFKESLLEKKPKGAPDFHHSDAPDAEGRFRDLSPKKLAAWLIKTRKKDLKKISGSLTQQVVFNRNDDPKYADKMEKTRIEVYKQLGRDDLLDKKD
jgi:hypothetical protein